MDAHDDAEAVVIYPSLETILVEAFSKARPTRTSMQEWTDIAGNVLSITRNNPSRPIILEDKLLMRSNAKLLPLARRLSTRTVPFASESNDSFYAKLARLTAAVFMQNDTTYLELQARSYHDSRLEAAPEPIDSLARDILLMYEERDTLKSKFMAKVSEIEQKTNDILSTQKMKDVELSRFKKQVENMKKSTSWRVTAPIRRVVLLVRAPKRKKR